LPFIPIKLKFFPTGSPISMSLTTSSLTRKLPVVSLAKSPGNSLEKSRPEARAIFIVDI
jgi:hypothetical protein